jgi:hypothetical protein
MITIWKYNLAPIETQEIDLPKGGKILTVQVQVGLIALWALVDPSAPTDRITIEIFGTGHEVTDGTREYLGTVQQVGCALIWHIFRRLA